jgi:predicted phosphodiesterase
MTIRRAERVAVLADVHGNLPALEAVLAEPDVRGADAIVLLGDIALGPMPAQTLERLAGLGDQAVWVHGNCEREMVTAFDGVPGANGGGANGGEANGGEAARSAGLIGREHRDLLDGLPLTVTLEVAGLGEVLLCHATPRRDDEFVLVDSSPEQWAAVLAGVTAQVVVLGHTHMPFFRLAGAQVVNAGSVGMPYGPAGASWALLGPGGVTLRRTLYDTAAAAAVIGADGAEWAAQWAAEFVLAHYSDTEALAEFTRIAGEQAL